MAVPKIDGIKNSATSYKIDPLMVSIDDQWNPRKDFGDMEELENSILENGVINPIRIRRDAEGKAVLVDGNRRLQAVLNLINKKGIEIKAVPCIVEPNKINDAQALINAFISNTGKPLLPIEEAEVYSRLEKWGMSVQEIAQKVGKSHTTIRKRLELHNAGPELTEALLNKEVDNGQALNVIKESNGNLEKQSELTQVAKENKGKRGPKTKEEKELLDNALDQAAMSDELKELYEEGEKENFDPIEKDELDLKTIPGAKITKRLGVVDLRQLLLDVSEAFSCSDFINDEDVNENDHLLKDVLNTVYEHYMEEKF